MKASPIESILSLSASGSAFLVVFHKSLGLSDSWNWPLLILMFLLLTPLLILQRRRRTARLAAGLPPSEKPPSRRRLWLLIGVVVLAAVSSFFWLPYTGPALPPTTRVITSVISCVIAIAALVFSWRYWNKKV